MRILAPGLNGIVFNNLNNNISFDDGATDGICSVTVELFASDLTLVGSTTI